jgi:hypothetical protein
MKDTESGFMMKSLYNNLRPRRLTPVQTKDGKELKPLSATDRLGPKIAQPIISQPQGLIPKKTRIRINYESNYQRSAREMEPERTAREIETKPMKKSARVVESETSKKSNNSEPQSVELLSQSDTEILSTSEEEERKEHRSERSKIHLRPGRLKRPG